QRAKPAHERDRAGLRPAGSSKLDPYEGSADRTRKNVSAALTTWHVASAASADDTGPGAPRWELTLTRCRGARVPRCWQVEWPGTELIAPAKPRRIAPAIADTARRAG